MKKRNLSEIIKSKKEELIRELKLEEPAKPIELTEGEFNLKVYNSRQACIDGISQLQTQYMKLGELLELANRYKQNGFLPKYLYHEEVKSFSCEYEERKIGFETD